MEHVLVELISFKVISLPEAITMSTSTRLFALQSTFKRRRISVNDASLRIFRQPIRDVLWYEILWGMVKWLILKINTLEIFC